MSLADAARELDVSPATLRRWVADGLVPLADGDWTRGSLSHARIVKRLRARGHSLDEIREASSSGRLAYGFVEDIFPPRSKTYTLEEAADDVRPRAGADRADLGRRRLLGAGAGRDHRGRPRAAALHRRGAAGRLPARRLPPARARLRAGAGADRRRRGEALPPLRPRAADPRGRRPPRDGGGDAGPRARPAPARRADHGPRPPALPPALPRPGRRRPHGARGRLGRRPRPRPPARGDRLRRPRGLHAPDRGGGGGRGGRHHRALRRGGRQHAARRRPHHQDDRGRGDGRRLRRGGAARLGRRLPAAAARAPAAAHRHPPGPDALPRRRLLRPRGQPRGAGGRARRGRRGARHAPAGRGRGGPHLEFEHIGEVKLKGFSQSTELFLARRAERE